jgi:hypothetical protein
MGRMKGGIVIAGFVGFAIGAILVNQYPKAVEGASALSDIRRTADIRFDISDRERECAFRLRDAGKAQGFAEALAMFTGTDEDASRSQKAEDHASRVLMECRQHDR